MSTDEYVPSEARVRTAYRYYADPAQIHHPDTPNAEVDRFLARARRDAEAAVLREAAEYMNDDQDAQYLMDCARDIEESP